MHPMPVNWVNSLSVSCVVFFYSDWSKNLTMPLLRSSHNETDDFPLLLDTSERNSRRVAIFCFIPITIHYV